MSYTGTTLDGKTIIGTYWQGGEIIAIALRDDDNEPEILMTCDGLTVILPTGAEVLSFPTVYSEN